MNIRLEEPKDYFEVENLTREAFWNVYRPGCYEHLIVHNIRNDKCFIKELDYVIEEDNKIIANIIYAKAKLELEDGTIKDTLIFGPVSVLPDYQNLGYGEELIKYTMNKAKELGYNEILITGNPNYYKKYGFESASKYHIYYKKENKDKELPFFMISILNKGKYNIKSAYYIEPDCYTVDEEELTEFDKLFPPKVKEKRKGQLV